MEHNHISIIAIGHDAHFIPSQYIYSISKILNSLWFSFWFKIIKKKIFKQKKTFMTKSPWLCNKINVFKFNHNHIKWQPVIILMMKKWIIIIIILVLFFCWMQAKIHIVSIFQWVFKWLWVCEVWWRRNFLVIFEAKNKIFSHFFYSILQTNTG